MDDRAEPQRVGGRLEPLGIELVLDEPLVRARHPPLQRVGGEDVAPAKLPEHGGRAQRAGPQVGVAQVREHRLDPRAMRGHARRLEHRLAVERPAAERQRPGEVALARRLRDRRHGALGAALSQRLAGAVGTEVEQVADLVEEGRARQRRAVLVASLPAQVQAIRRARDAGVKQVPLLVGRVRAPQVGIADLPAAVLGKQRVGRRGAREDAVLEREAKERPGARRPRPVGVEDPHSAGGRPAPQRHRRGLDRLDRARQIGDLAAGEAGEPGELGQQLGRGDPRPQLEGRERHPAGARERRQLAVRRLGELAGAAGERAEALRRGLGLAQPLQVTGRVLPVRDRLIDRGRVAAPDPCLDRVDGARRQRRVEPQVSEQRVDRGLVGGGSAEGDQGAADLGRRERERRLERHRDPHLPQDGREQPPARIRVAEDDRDVVGFVAGAQQARDLDPHRLGLAAGAGGLEQDEAVVDRDAVGPRLEQRLIEVPQGRAGGVALLEWELLRGLGPAVAQGRDQPGPRREGPAVGERDRDRHRGRGGERVDQLELGAREVVEAVHEHGPRAPAVGIGAERPDRGCGGGRPVAAAAALTQLGVAGVEGRELALVAGLVEVADDGGELGRRDQRRLELGDQAGERRREPRPGRRAPQPARVGGVDRGAHERLALRGGELGRRSRRQGRGDLARQRVEGRDRTAQRRRRRPRARVRTP